MNDGLVRYHFVGGPHDGEKHLSKDLLHDPAKAETIAWEEYASEDKWTETDEGLVRVWNWAGPTTAKAPEKPAPATAAVEPVEAVDEPQTPAQDAEEPVETALPEVPAGETTSAVESTTPLKDRRVAAKLSRKQLVGPLSEGVIARIETKGGKPEEIQLFIEALERNGA